MSVEGAADYLKPEQDTAIAKPNWYVSGYGRFMFSSKADAEQAIELSKAVERGHQVRIARAIEQMIG